ncbi:MAG: hypothetical protein ACPGWS_07275 [Solirubrobacterales bacterium]
MSIILNAILDEFSGDVAILNRIGRAAGAANVEAQARANEKGMEQHQMLAQAELASYLVLDAQQRAQTAEPIAEQVRP